MFQRRTTGSVVCPSCGSLVGVRDGKCYTCGRANPGLWGFGPMIRRLGADLGFVPIVIGSCSILYLITLFMFGGSGLRMTGGAMSMLAPNAYALFVFGESGAIPVFTFGRWWTVLSASWLHGSLLHILFNMWALRQIGPASVDIIGPGRTVIIYVVAGATGFLLSSFAGAYFGGMPLFFLRGAPFTVGASASIFGLIGALIHYGNRGSSMVKQWAMSYVIGAVIFGLMMPGIDNYAHAGGFAGGYLLSAFFNPMTPERGDHLLIALVCLVASAVAVIVSVVTGLPLVPH